MKQDSGMQAENKDQLRFVGHARINFRLYDQCVANAGTSLVYAWSWYLDIMAGEWDALVWGNYSYVMPVPTRRKWGIRYVYTPVFAQQLGIYPTPPVEIQKAFIDRLTHRFRYINYQTGNDLNENILAGFTVKPLHTRVLSLEPGYEDISSQYAGYIRRNLKKAGSNGIEIFRQTDPSSFFRLQKESKDIPVPGKSWTCLRKLMEATLPNGRGLIYAASGPSGEINAAAFFVVWNNRAYYLMVVSDHEGREKRAVFALLDRFIHDFEGQPVIFDFEGSAVPGVDSFFESFGAVKEPYRMLSLNRLPGLMKLIKR